MCLCARQQHAVKLQLFLQCPMGCTNRPNPANLPYSGESAWQRLLNQAPRPFCIGTHPFSYVYTPTL
jgi:hypothetical protein